VSTVELPRSLPFALLVGLLLLSAGPAVAHGISVFAYAEGARIQGSAHYTGGSPARGLRIAIMDDSGRLLSESRTAEDGSFSYLAQEPVAHQIVVNSGDGHQARWRISAGELAQGFRFSEEGGTEATDSTDRSVDRELEAAVERAVARQLAPLRRELLAERDRLRLQDMVGAIGYIAGLAGLALWWGGRHPRGSDER
jgi:nickel transport protein